MSNVYLSHRAGKPLLKWLRDNGYTPVIINDTDGVYDAVSSHADIYMCKMGISADSALFKCDFEELGYSYPNNICYNAVALNKYFIHNFKHTSKRLLSYAKEHGFELIDVKQGYTKCSTVIVDGSSVITSDEGIVKALSRYNDIDVLKVKSGYVKLIGFEYGFLGGTSGRVGNTVLFNGDLSAHPDFDIIIKFITEKGLEVKYFEEYPLEDIGSIIESVF